MFAMGQNNSYRLLVILIARGIARGIDHGIALLQSTIEYCIDPGI